MRVFLLTLLLAASNALALQGPSAHFDTDQSEVINASEIRSFAATLPKGSAIRIYCHTDSRASDAHNLALAERRCEAVRQFFDGMDHRVDDFLVVGEDEILVGEIGKNTDLHGRFGLNRRVEIFYELAEKRSFKRHRIQLYLGRAPGGLDSEISNNGVAVVEQDYDLEGGLGYSFRVTETFSLGVAAFTNKSFFGTLGVDF